MITITARNFSQQLDQAVEDNFPHAVPDTLEFLRHKAQIKLTLAHGLMIAERDGLQTSKMVRPELSRIPGQDEARVHGEVFHLQVGGAEKKKRLERLEREMEATLSQYYALPQMTAEELKKVAALDAIEEARLKRFAATTLPRLNGIVGYAAEQSRASYFKTHSLATPLEELKLNDRQRRLVIEPDGNVSSHDEAGFNSYFDEAGRQHGSHGPAPHAQETVTRRTVPEWSFGRIAALEDQPMLRNAVIASSALAGIALFTHGALKAATAKTQDKEGDNMRDWGATARHAAEATAGAGLGWIAFVNRRIPPTVEVIRKAVPLLR